MTSAELAEISKNLNLQSFMDCFSSIPVMNYFMWNYGSKLFVNDFVLYRQFCDSPSHTGFAFPIPMKDADSDYLKKSLLFLQDFCSANNQPLQFCLITQDQKNQIDKIVNECSQFSGKKILWNTSRNDSEYIYRRQNLVDLKGDILQKKKNHISRFMRKYENRWSFKTWPENPVKEDLILVAQNWLNEKVPVSPELQKEFESICQLLALPDVQMKGAVLYVDQEPVAMTLASPVSQSVLDINFEKATGEPAKNGAYAVINQLFAQTQTTYDYFNREEDLGIPGLRKAKLSYKPEILLDKFYGNLQ